MAFWLKGGKFVSGECEECPCKYPCEDEEGNDPTCPCLSPTPTPPPDASSSQSGPSTPPAPQHCIYFAVFVITCPCTGNTDEKCPPSVCNCTTIVSAIDQDQLTLPDPCCPPSSGGAGGDEQKEECQKIAREPEAGSDVVGHTNCGGTIHRPSPTFCTEQEAKKWLEEHPCPLKECSGYYGLFLARMVIKGDTSENPCAADSYRCETFTAHVNGDGVIPAITIMDNAVECLSVGGGSSITDEATGNTIEIKKLSSGEPCTMEELQAWINEHQDSIDKKVEEMCGGGGCPVILKGDSIYGSGVSIEGYCSTGNDEYVNYDQNYYGCDRCEPPADKGSIKIVAYGPDMEKKTLDTVDCSFNSGCTDCLWGHVTDGYDGEGTCSWCKGIQARASQCSCNNTLDNKKLQAAANPDNWFTYPVTIGLPATLSAHQRADGPGSGYKGLKVEKDPDSDSEATGVDLCITKIEKKSDEETVETTKKSVKFGGEIGDITAHATLERYSCESYDITDRPYEDYEETCGEKLHSKRSITIPGEDASVEWHITVLQCTYD